MSDPQDSGVAPVRYENGSSFIIAGLGERYTLETNSGIPALWQAFEPFIGKVPGQQGGETYGVCCNPEGDSFEYIAGVRVSTTKGLPPRFRSVVLEPQHYAVFEHRGPISSISKTFQAIWKTWLPVSGKQAADTPEFERYSADFNPLTGSGTVEIWLPIKP
ncbi:GyrI-like domain-containing protein [Pseudomonas sp. LS1212]|uniref:GyrI-like domain-containing protein n=1 Tax=Pseudomonas sp. LS1212 TaxID=2972478 RepID=UPI00215BF5DF|nr:GyrI-like domain-containing protein [Pseudomonas sp. LS1212]UVJ45282.1 GyrI-like domain-containing protein [Pseudomonas sp. LS1212]